jgi:hypothetical protein
MLDITWSTHCHPKLYCSSVLKVDAIEKVVIHIVSCKSQFPSKMSLAYVTFVATAVILLLTEYLRKALVLY